MLQVKQSPLFFKNLSGIFAALLCLDNRTIAGNAEKMALLHPT
jgi:hypothetical protein